MSRLSDGRLVCDGCGETAHDTYPVEIDGVTVTCCSCGVAVAVEMTAESIVAYLQARPALALAVRREIVAAGPWVATRFDSWRRGGDCGGAVAAVAADEAGGWRWMAARDENDIGVRGKAPTACDARAFADAALREMGVSLADEVAP